MSARISLLALLMAFFGLQAPLCAMACAGFAAATSDLPDRIVADIASPTSIHDSTPEMPCHGNTESTPDETPASHENCDCEAIDALALADAAHSGQRPKTTAAPVAGPASEQLVVSQPRLAHPPDRGPRLPVPDILLLKSTLLI